MQNMLQFKFPVETKHMLLGMLPNKSPKVSFEETFEYMWETAARIVDAEKGKSEACPGFEGGENKLPFMLQWQH